MFPELDKFRRHPSVFFQGAKDVKYVAPGFGIAFAAFGVYVFYDKMTSRKDNAHGHGGDSHGHH